jgi:hypothetical protein
VLSGTVWGVIQAAAPLGFCWLNPAMVDSLSLTLIAAVYIVFIGFDVADGRPAVIAFEPAITGVLVVVAEAVITAPAAGGRPHRSWGKDLWQHRGQYVATTAGGRCSAWSSTRSPRPWSCSSPSARLPPLDR